MSSVEETVVLQTPSNAFQELRPRVIVLVAGDWIEVFR